MKTFFETPVKYLGFFPAAAASLLLAFSAAFWFGTLQTVDPVHHTVSRYNGAFYNIIAIFFPLAAILLFLFRKNKMRVTPAGLICAAGAAFTAFLPTFTSLALYLVLFSSAIWLCFGSECKNFSDSKFFITVPAVLFVYTLVCGIEYQLSAYNKLIFLYSDWGIYFSGYKQLADAPFESFTQWLSVGNHFNVSVNLIMALAVKLLPKAQTLFVVNSLLLASLIPLVYWFGRTLKMPAVLCALCSAAIAFNPMFSNQHTTLFYGYHPIVFLAPSFILFCIAKEKRCLGGMIFAGIFMCGIKETVFVFAAGSAFLIPSCKNRWLFSVAILGITAAIFLLLTHIILPNCDNSGHYFQLFQYNSLGKNSVEVLLSPFVSPAAFWGKLFRPGNFSFLLLLLLPFLPAAWKAPRFLLAALPVMLGIMLKDCYIDRHNIVQQYGTEISVWFTAAMIYGTSSAFNRNHLTAGFAAALLTGSMAGYYFVGRTPIGGTYSAAAVRHSPDIRIMREHIKKIIPSAASVALSQKWGAQLVESHKNLILLCLFSHQI